MGNFFDDLREKVVEPTFRWVSLIEPISIVREELAGRGPRRQEGLRSELELASQQVGVESQRLGASREAISVEQARVELVREQRELELELVQRLESILGSERFENVSQAYPDVFKQVTGLDVRKPGALERTIGGLGAVADVIPDTPLAQGAQEKTFLLLLVAVAGGVLLLLTVLR